MYERRSCGVYKKSLCAHVRDTLPCVPKQMQAWSLKSSGADVVVEIFPAKKLKLRQSETLLGVRHRFFYCSATGSFVLKKKVSTRIRMRSHQFTR